MGVFSKIFGGGKVELSDESDESLGVEQDVQSQADKQASQNTEPSPFLVEDGTTDQKE